MMTTQKNTPEEAQKVTVTDFLGDAPNANSGSSASGSGAQGGGSLGEGASDNGIPGSGAPGDGSLGGSTSDNDVPGDGYLGGGTSDGSAAESESDSRSDRNFTGRHRGRLAQIPIYLGKDFRMFIFQNDWKVLPMAALIAGIIALVVGQNMFVTMEGQFQCSLALSCICIWNGFFNSIQVVCRERPIIKREHRSGMHITSYIISHLIYQMFLCAMQALLTVVVCRIAGIKFPENGFITKWFLVDIWITLFLITYAADVTSLFISCIVRNTTTAMTVMPFMLIIQLVFSGGAFTLSGPAEKLTYLTISKYGLVALCAQGNYNSLRSVTLWNTIFKLRDSSEEIKQALWYIEKEGQLDQILVESGKAMQEAAYAMTKSNIFGCWAQLIFFAVFFAILSIIVLEFVDNDKR